MCQRFLLVAENEFQRLLQTSDKPSESIPITNTEPETRLDILEVLPARLKSAAGALVTAFRQHYTPELFTWDQKTGEITVKGEKVINSNIVDLVWALLQPFQRTALKGLQQLTELLRESNFLPS